MMVTHPCSANLYKLVPTYQFLVIRKYLNWEVPQKTVYSNTCIYFSHIKCDKMKHRPQKDNSAVSFNDILLNFRLWGPNKHLNLLIYDTHSAFTVLSLYIQLKLQFKNTKTERYQYLILIKPHKTLE